MILINPAIIVPFDAKVKDPLETFLDNLLLEELHVRVHTRDIDGDLQ